MKPTNWNDQIDFEFQHPDSGDFGDDLGLDSFVLKYLKKSMIWPEENAERIYRLLQKIGDMLGSLEIFQEMGYEISEQVPNDRSLSAKELKEELFQAEKSFQPITLELTGLCAGLIPILSCDVLPFLETPPTNLWNPGDYNMAVAQHLALENAIGKYPGDSPIVIMAAKGLLQTLRSAERLRQGDLPRLEQLASGGGHGNA